MHEMRAYSLYGPGGRHIMKTTHLLHALSTELQKDRGQPGHQQGRDAPTPGHLLGTNRLKLNLSYLSKIFLAFSFCV